MKKPLILVVDDDPGVLAALEVFFNMRFRGICRVEAFDTPREVLEALPRWQEEKRPVAVVVADQMMPEILGVELLERMRGHQATSDMRSILLTAYPGLDSVLRAKNRAGADRYFTKPWKTDQIESAVDDLLQRYLVDSGRRNYLVLEPVKDAETFEEVFRLRYRVYRTTPLAVFLQSNADEADLDGHDRHSIILGLVRHEGASRKLVGTLRLVTRRPSPVLDAMREAAAQLPSVKSSLDEEITTPFPFVKRFEDRDLLEAFVGRLEADGASVAEVGRHAILPEERKGQADQRQIEGTAAFFFFFRIRYGLAGIPPLHQRHYRTLGFEEIPGIRRIETPFHGMAIWSALDQVREPVKGRLPALKERLHTPENGRGGNLCFCSTYPDCLPDAYVSGDFAATDLFCPLAADKALGG